jgi:diguanylate cyclase (GGDEF)-like protein
MGGNRHLLVLFGLLAAVPVAAGGLVLSQLPAGSATLATGLGTVYALLFPVVAFAARGLNRRAADNERLAGQDVLTGIPNRRLFTRRLEKLLADGERVAVIVADIDELKLVNDRYGHVEGDELLRRTACQLSKALRTTDTVARLGGDEFGILLPGAAREDAQLVARRILDTLPVRASLGLACSPENGRGYDSLFQAADLAMYEAKRHGGCYRVATNGSGKPKAPGQAVGGLRPVRRAAPAKGG